MGKPPPKSRGGHREGAGRKAEWIRKKCQDLIDRHHLFDEVARLAKHAKKDVDRLRAIELLIDRAHGKAAQPVEVEGALAVNWTIKVQGAETK